MSPLLNEYYRSEMGSFVDIDECFSQLQQRTVPVLFVFSRHRRHVEILWNEVGISVKALPWYQNALVWPSEVPFGNRLPGYEEGMLYPMNASSLVPPCAMEVDSLETVCDVASAPGGKTCVLFQEMDEHGILIANDVSFGRLNRQKKLFSSMQITGVAFTCMPAEVLSHTYHEFFDAVLVDAPCSSEKHVFSDPKELKKWTPNRSVQLHKRQVELVRSVMNTVKSGGRIVYATCALLPAENELVVAEVLESTNLSLVPWPLQNVPGEEGFSIPGRTNFDVRKVRRILPSRENNLDPMFVAVFIKP